MLVVLGIERIVPDFGEGTLRRFGAPAANICVRLASLSHNNHQRSVRRQNDWFIENNVLSVKVRADRFHYETLRRNEPALKPFRAWTSRRFAQ